MAVRCTGGSQWAEGEILFTMKPYSSRHTVVKVMCSQCGAIFQRENLKKSATSHGDDAVYMVPEHGEPEPVAYSTSKTPLGRAGAIWEEFIEVAEWARSQQGYTDEARKLAARIIVGINTLPALSLLTVVTNAQQARNAHTFKQSITGLLGDGIPNSERRKFAGTWDIVMSYYKEVARGDRS